MIFSLCLLSCGMYVIGSLVLFMARVGCVNKYVKVFTMLCRAGEKTRYPDLKTSKTCSFPLCSFLLQISSGHCNNYILTIQYQINCKLFTECSEDAICLWWGEGILKTISYHPKSAVAWCREICYLVVSSTNLPSTAVSSENEEVLFKDRDRYCPSMRKRSTKKGLTAVATTADEKTLWQLSVDLCMFFSLNRYVVYIAWIIHCAEPPARISSCRQ